VVTEIDQVVERIPVGTAAGEGYGIVMGKEGGFLKRSQPLADREGEKKPLDHQIVDAVTFSKSDPYVTNCGGARKETQIVYQTRCRRDPTPGERSLAR